MARPALALLVSVGVFLSTSAQAATPPDGVPKRPERYNVPEASTLIGQADAHYNRGDYTAALETYTRAYQKAALREASIGLALSYANLGKLDEASCPHLSPCAATR